MQQRFFTVPVIPPLRGNIQYPLFGCWEAEEWIQDEDPACFIGKRLTVTKSYGMTSLSPGTAMLPTTGKYHIDR